jgi:hypothetical protein
MEIYIVLFLPSKNLPLSIYTSIVTRPVQESHCAIPEGSRQANGLVECVGLLLYNGQFDTTGQAQNIGMVQFFSRPQVIVLVARGTAPPAASCLSMLIVTYPAL